VSANRIYLARDEAVNDSIQIDWKGLMTEDFGLKKSRTDD